MPPQHDSGKEADASHPAHVILHSDSLVLSLVNVLLSWLHQHVSVSPASVWFTLLMTLPASTHQLLTVYSPCT